MDNVKQVVQNTVEKVEEVVGMKQPVAETVEVPNEPKTDRSAYNCPVCGGEGLVNGARCPQCGGTGKVN